MSGFSAWLLDSESDQIKPLVEFVKADKCWPARGNRQLPFLVHLGEHGIRSGPIFAAFHAAHERYRTVRARRRLDRLAAKVARLESVNRVEQTV